MKESMNPWYSNDALIQRFEASPDRKEWCENGAYEHFFDLEWQLPTERKDRARVGALFVAEMTGTEGKNFWFFPVEGHKKILAPKSDIALFLKTGEIFFEGQWSGCSEEIITKNLEFYVWLKPIANRETVKPSLTQKVKGLFRLAKHKIKH